MQLNVILSGMHARQFWKIVEFAKGRRSLPDSIVISSCIKDLD